MTPKDTTPDPVHPAPAPSLVEAVAMALCENALAGKACPCRENGKFNCDDAYPGYQARAALSVTDPAIERMREALELIANTDPDEGTAWFHDVANRALQEQQP